MPPRSPKVLDMMDLDDGGDVQQVAEVIETRQLPRALKPVTAVDRMPVNVVVDESLRSEIERVFGVEAMSDARKVAAIGKSFREFQHHTTRVLESIVSLGRSLHELSQAVGKENMARAVRESRLLFRGWSRGNLVKMMAVAEFVDRSDVGLERLPQGWTTVYELSTMPEPALERARAGNLIAPNVTRGQVVAFKRRLADDGLYGDVRGGDVSEKARQEARLKRLRDKLADLDSERKRTLQAIKEVQASIFKNGE